MAALKYLHHVNYVVEDLDAFIAASLKSGL